MSKVKEINEHLKSKSVNATAKLMGISAECGYKLKDRFPKLIEFSDNKRQEFKY